MKPQKTPAATLICLAFGLLVFISPNTQTAQGQQVQVTAADPPSAEQGTINLNVKITGKGFKKGAAAKFFVTGTSDTGGVQVNATAFVNSGELTANIDVADTATIANFDIQVLNSDGRGGKGTELFAVVAKGTGKPCSGGVGVLLTFGDRVDDKVQGTGANSYSGGAIGCEGRFRYIFDHAVHYDLNSPFNIADPNTPPLGAFDNVSNIGIAVADPPGQLGSLLLMGQSASAYQVQFNVVNGDNRYFVQFGEQYSGTGASAPDVTLSGSQPQRIWTIETNTTTGDLANVVICPAHGFCKKPGGGLYHVAFKITLAEQ
jgi:hypothetical protein